MSTKSERDFYDTKRFKAVGYTMAGVGYVIMAAQSTKKFVEEHMTPVIVTSAVVAATTIAVSVKTLNDKEHSFPE